MHAQIKYRNVEIKSNQIVCASYELTSWISRATSALNKYNIKQSGYYYADINHYCKYQPAQELKKIMASSMHDDSLEGIESKIKLIDR